MTSAQGRPQPQRAQQRGRWQLWRACSSPTSMRTRCRAHGLYDGLVGKAGKGQPPRRATTSCASHRSVQCAANRLRMNPSLVDHAAPMASRPEGRRQNPCAHCLRIRLHGPSMTVAGQGEWHGIAGLRCVRIHGLIARPRITRACQRPAPGVHATARTQVVRPPTPSRLRK